REVMNLFSRIRSEEHVFLTACIIGAFAILSSTMAKNPVLNPFAESLGTPEAFMGFIAAASTLPGVIISFPAGSLSDMWGRRKVLLASAFVFASAPFLYIFIRVWWQLMLVRFYHGFATAIFIPVARATVAEYYPSKKGERLSTFTSATIIGRGIAPFLGGALLAFTVWNFQILYLAVGIAGVTTLFLTVTLLKEKKVTAVKRSSPIPDTERIESTASGWRTILSNPYILAASTTEAAARYVYGALEFFLIGYLKNVALLDPSLIGIIMGMQLVLIPIISPLMGRLSDKIGRRIPIAAGLIISGLPLILLPFVTGFLPLLALSVMYGVGLSTVVSSTPALVGDLTSRESYGAAMGFLATVMDVGQMLGPMVTGFILATFGYSSSFFSLGVILFGFCLLFSISQKS
ncbi:MAG: MFS transporter, partial [Candidatus Bathyarchaeota archaeon]